jgi:hypothetical protein
MVSSDERLKEIRKPGGGTRYCRVGEKRRVLEDFKRLGWLLALGIKEIDKTS